ncbi:hypothetical protein [Actinoplanes sp. NPDC026623]|uniref:hypothetical protein n=1 Tax=Actinoplanes sp. NPDC026623 TaxID=3155610 RepID=UPI0033D521FF
MPTEKPALNSRVIIDDGFATANRRGVVYIVTKHNQVKVVIAPENPDDPAGGSINPAYLRPAPPVGATPPRPAPAQVVEYLPPLTHGTVVTVDSPTWKQPSEWLWVVLGESNGNRPDMYRIARLGGMSGREYWRMHRSRMIPIDPQRITVTAA